MFCYYLGEDRWLSFYHQSFWLESKSNVEKIVDLNHGRFERLLSLSRLGIRFLRLEPRCIERLDMNRFVFSYRRKMWLLDIEQKSTTILMNSRDRFSNPLNICSDGEYLYWGDYGDNTGNESVNIYRLGPDLSIQVVYCFPAGDIRHIHNLIWDSKYMRFYVLTGDLEKRSGIYMASHDWSIVTPWVIGMQQYRAVIAFPHQGGLLYATDTVEEENRVYLLKNNELHTLGSFPGSCIYGTEIKDYYVFSSTVEPAEGRNIWDFFTYKLGKGIKDRYAHLIVIGKNNLHIKEVLKVKKDEWPMKLFQYGVLTFPKGQEQNAELVYNIIACKGDGDTKKIYI